MMVTIDGIRYRVEDAEALGLIRLGVIDDKAASTPVNRGRAK